MAGYLAITTPLSLYHPVPSNKVADCWLHPTVMVSNSILYHYLFAIFPSSISALPLARRVKDCWGMGGTQQGRHTPFHFEAGFLKSYLSSLPRQEGDGLLGRGQEADDGRKLHRPAQGVRPRQHPGMGF